MILPATVRQAACAFLAAHLSPALHGEARAIADEMTRDDLVACASWLADRLCQADLRELTVSELSVAALYAAETEA